MKPTSGRIARILDLLAEGHTVREVVALTATSTTVVYKVINDFPLWAPQASRKLTERFKSES